MGFLNDLASIASGMKEFKDELQSMKDEVVSSFADVEIGMYLLRSRLVFNAAFL